MKKLLFLSVALLFTGANLLASQHSNIKELPADPIGYERLIEVKTIQPVNNKTTFYTDYQGLKRLEKKLGKNNVETVGTKLFLAPHPVGPGH